MPAVSFPGLSAERRLLLALALVHPNAANQGLSRLAAEVRSWEAVLASAVANQLRPQLAAALKRIGSNAPPAVVAELDEYVAANRGHARLLSAELLRACRALDASGVRAIPFKGPAFALLLGTGPEAREMADLDLAVEARDLGRAASALEALGFEGALRAAAVSSKWLPSASHELGFVRPQDGLTIELHWRLGPAWFPAPIETRDAFARVNGREFLGTEILWPAAEELLLMHVSDGMKSCGCGMRWLGDMATILRRHPDLEWERIRDVARRNGGVGSLAVAMAALQGALEEASRALDGPPGPELPEPARSLAHAARERPRLAGAVRAIHARIACDIRETRALAHFGWALRVADHRVAAACAVARYLSGPAIPDLRTMTATDESALSLRWRALRRRLAAVSP